MGLIDGPSMRWPAHVAFFLVAVSPLASGADLPLQATRGIVEQWVQTRQLISRTRADGEAMKELLGQTKAIHERELQSLYEALTRSNTNSPLVTL